MSTVNKDEGFVLGSDGCGVIVKVGEGLDSALVGKKVSFLGGGWSRFAVKDYEYVVFFPDDFDLKHGANTYVNPFTVTAMVDFAQKHGAKAVILMAASSALAKQMIKLCQKEGLETINIVRKQEHVTDLFNTLGVKYVFNSESPTFTSNLQTAIDETLASVLFECVGGDLAGEIFKMMPSKSVMVVYGNLSKQKNTFEP